MTAVCFVLQQSVQYTFFLAYPLFFNNMANIGFVIILDGVHWQGALKYTHLRENRPAPGAPEQRYSIVAVAVGHQTEV